jgi:erythromycin esterase-like protein
VFNDTVEGMMNGLDAATVLRLLPARPRILALGEPTHGADLVLEARNQLFRQLVEQDGYRTIALESDCVMGLVVDDYVISGTGTLAEAMERGFSHEWGAFPGNRELVRWMRSYNDGRPAGDQVHFAGIDGPLEITAAASPRPSLTALHAYLTGTGLLPCTAEKLDRLLGPDTRWTNPAAMMDPSQSVGQTPEAKELRLLADDLVALLDAQPPGDGWDRARFHGRTATGLLRYHYWMADPSPSRMTRLLTVRDTMMSANMLALAEQGPTLVNAHNSHLQREKSTMRMGGPLLNWWGAGAIVSAHLGRDYAFLATALGTIRHQGVDIPPPDTLEGLLYALPADRYLVDPGRLAATPLTPRVSAWYGYAPLDPAHLPTIDGVVFVKNAS